MARDLLLVAKRPANLAEVAVSDYVVRWPAVSGSREQSASVAALRP